MKTLKVILQDVVSGIKAWATANFSNETHVHGNITNDGKVGTTANLPLITGTGGVVQAGAFGNQANTFCEGNDSRLSDARTPVAHTHTKSDVTDLFNSDFIPSANNSYNLGSSSYQWNNLYAKNYYYNGVAWGLDKDNVWSNINSYQREIRLNGDRDAYIAPMWDGASSGIAFLNSDATKTFVFGQHTTDANNKKVIDGTKGRLLIRTGERNGETVVDFEPRATNAILGTSTNKWKTLNGVNPGALSFPNKDNKVDITSEFTDLTGGSVYYIPPADGWINITADDEIYCAVVSSTHSTIFWSQSALATSISNACVTIPVRNGLHFLAKIKSTNAITATFYPCLGNV